MLFFSKCWSWKWNATWPTCKLPRLILVLISNMSIQTKLVWHYLKFTFFVYFGGCDLLVTKYASCHIVSFSFCSLQDCEAYDVVVTTSSLCWYENVVGLVTKKVWKRLHSLALDKLVLIKPPTKSSITFHSLRWPHARIPSHTCHRQLFPRAFTCEFRGL